ncbi:hypothetical protein FSP39_008959 [Pinctada imbricata]|uniref:Transmembrane and coiled-coil domains protein 1 n=1 Tax=Pinctada imbricata TaxID=66713 RepID=A0AA88XNP4_PINIB|nr:hypothetical protein FSP39_008959 [Pinctada imbricata]
MHTLHLRNLVKQMATPPFQAFCRVYRFSYQLETDLILPGQTCQTGTTSEWNKHGSCRQMSLLRRDRLPMSVVPPHKVALVHELSRMLVKVDWLHISCSLTKPMAVTTAGKTNGKAQKFLRKSDASKIPALKSVKKVCVPSKSPSLPKKPQSSPDNVAPGGKPRSGSNLSVPTTEDPSMVRSTEDLESEEVSSRENGSSGEGALDEFDGAAPGETDPQKTKAAIDHIQTKITRTMDLIKEEQAVKEQNVNEYLRLAGSADKQQLTRIKAAFEKKNQKSTQSLSSLQKKLEGYHKRQAELEKYGVSSHKPAKEVLKDVGHGLKGVGANIVDGITGFSGGVVDKAKGAKDSIVSKPKEFAHLIKNKFGSADNITQMKVTEEGASTEGEKTPHGSTLPASFKYPSEDDASSITSESGVGQQSSPPSLSHNASQNLPMSPQIQLEPIMHELEEFKEAHRRLEDLTKQILEEFQDFKVKTQSETSLLQRLLDEERYRTERLEEQINDMSELHQNEMTNLRQDISSMEEKIEYRLDERTTDIHEMLENCQTRVTKMELQQQQQQIISMEMVDNVTFRTLLTKLLNVVLAILAVILVFVSTAANLVAPFLTTRARILSTIVLIVSVVVIGRNYDVIFGFIAGVYNYFAGFLPAS